MSDRRDRDRRDRADRQPPGRRPPHTPEIDAVVVGAGYSGPLVARELARAGKRVVVLEAGPAWTSRDLVSSQIWARRLRASTGSYRSVGRDPINLGFNVGRGLGGAGIHHFGGWFRMHPEDFELRTRYGRQLDWPIGYDDLRTYYDRIQTDVGLSGDARAEVWRPPGEPYPLPPLRVHTHGRVLKKGFDALGLRTAPSPAAILSRPYRGRPACTYDGWCDAGCAIGALGNPLVTFIPQAREAGVEFRTGAQVTRVLTEGDRATGVEYVDAQGARQVLEAKLVVLAAFALETPRILLNSADGGLANSSGLVGRFLHVHTLMTVYGLFDERTDASIGTVAAQLLCQDMVGADPAKGYFGGWQWLAGGAKKPNDLTGIAMARPDVRGPELEAFIKRGVNHLGAMDAIGHGTLSVDNRLELTDERDAFGMRTAVVTHAHDEDSHRIYEEAHAQGLAIMRAAGATEAWAGPRGVAHIMGGTIMGSDPRASVTDQHGRTHDVENLFISGPGVFPTGGSVNPTYTQVAWTLRSAEHIVRSWDSLT
jgi:choline dehydrogenase-like flavoprotein